MLLPKQSTSIPAATAAAQSSEKPVARAPRRRNAGGRGAYELQELTSDERRTLGYLAAALTTLSFAPQAWLTFRTRDVSGISLGMYSAFTLGVALWLAYGWRLGEWPIIIANAVTLLLAELSEDPQWRTRLPSTVTTAPSGSSCSRSSRPRRRSSSCSTTSARATPSPTSTIVPLRHPSSQEWDGS